LNYDQLAPNYACENELHRIFKQQMFSGRHGNYILKSQIFELGRHVFDPLKKSVFLLHFNCIRDAVVLKSEKECISINTAEKHLRMRQHYLNLYCERDVKCSECCERLKMEATSMFCLFYENASGIMNVTT
jgi:hypothetical protein